MQSEFGPLPFATDFTARAGEDVEDVLPRLMAALGAPPIGATYDPARDMAAAASMLALASALIMAGAVQLAGHAVIDEHDVEDALRLSTEVEHYALLAEDAGPLGGCTSDAARARFIERIKSNA